MLKKTSPQQKEISTTVMQRMLTWALIAFMIYFYFAEYKTEDKIDEEITGESKLILTNTVTKESKELKFPRSGRLSLSVKVSDLKAMNERPMSNDNDSVIVFDLELVKAKLEKSGSSDEDKASGDEDIVEKVIEEQSDETEIPEIVGEPVQIEIEHKDEAIIIEDSEIGEQPDPVKAIKDSVE